MKIPKNKYDIFVEVICMFCLIGIVMYLAIVWTRIPDEIPGHYNAMGEIDRFSSKGSLISLPIVAWIMYIGLSIIERFPQVWNTGVRITNENQARVYRTLKSMLGTVKMLIVAVFTYLTVNTAMAKTLSALFTPIFLILMFGAITYFIVKLIRVR